MWHDVLDSSVYTIGQVICLDLSPYESMRSIRLGCEQHGKGRRDGLSPRVLTVVLREVPQRFIPWLGSALDRGVQLLDEIGRHRNGLIG